MLCPIEARRPTQARHPMVLSQNKHRSSSHVLYPQRPSFKNLLQRHYHQNRPLAAWPPCANNSISQNRRPRSRRRSPHQQANLHPRQHLRTTLNDRHHSSRKYPAQARRKKCPPCEPPWSSRKTNRNRWRLFPSFSFHTDKSRQHRPSTP